MRSPETERWHEKANFSFINEKRVPRTRLIHTQRIDAQHKKGLCPDQNAMGCMKKVSKECKLYSREFEKPDSAGVKKLVSVDFSRFVSVNPNKQSASLSRAELCRQIGAREFFKADGAVAI